MVTDKNGRFSITLSDKAEEVVFSYVGMETTRVAVQRAAEKIIEKSANEKST